MRKALKTLANATARLGRQPRLPRGWLQPLATELPQATPRNRTYRFSMSRISAVTGNIVALLFKRRRPCEKRSLVRNSQLHIFPLAHVQVQKHLCSFDFNDVGRLILISCPQICTARGQGLQNMTRTLLKTFIILYGLKTVPAAPRC